jgi:hypothetical protein
VQHYHKLRRRCPDISTTITPTNIVITTTITTNIATITTTLHRYIEDACRIQEWNRTIIEFQVP